MAVGVPPTAPSQPPANTPQGDFTLAARAKYRVAWFLSRALMMLGCLVGAVMAVVGDVPTPVVVLGIVSLAAGVRAAVLEARLKKALGAEWALAEAENSKYMAIAGVLSGSVALITLLASVAGPLGFFAALALGLTAGMHVWYTRFNDERPDLPSARVAFHVGWMAAALGTAMRVLIVDAALWPPARAIREGPAAVDALPRPAFLLFMALGALAILSWAYWYFAPMLRALRGATGRGAPQPHSRPAPSASAHDDDPLGLD